jgi:hypothetical protein
VSRTFEKSVEVGGWFKIFYSPFYLQRERGKDDKIRRFTKKRNHLILSDNRTLQPFPVNFNKEYDILAIGLYNRYIL